MPLKDYITGRTNRIVVGSASAVGLIIMGAAGVSLLTPARQVRDSTGQVTHEVTLGGATRQSGSLVTRGVIASPTLANCNTIDGTSTGMLVCGTDTGGGGNFGSGNVVALGDSRYVNTAGDTVTGSLIIKNTLSGAHVFAGTLSGAGLSDCDADGQALSWDATAQKFVCGDDDTGAPGTTYTAGQGLTLSADSAFSVNSILTGTLVRFLTVSGALVQAKNTLASSGTLVWESSASGSSLTVSNAVTLGKFKGCNLDTDASGVLTCGTDADTSQNLFETIAVSGQSNVVADSATDTLTLAGGSNVTITTTAGTDTVTIAATDTNTTYTAGQGLSLSASSAFSLLAAHTGTTIRALNTLASSGTLIWEATASGQTLIISKSFSGAGLSDCDGATQTLNWDATTGRFSCGTDADTDTNTTYTAGKGLTLTSTAFSTNDTLTGTVLRFLTVSGALLKAKNTVASSGSLTWEGLGSGASLYVGDDFEGAGLVDCDTAGTSKLLWDSTAKRFGCGTDADTNTTYTAGQGLSLVGTSFRTNSVLSGVTLWATTALRSSGSLSVDGSISGHTLAVSGLRSCNTIDTDASGNLSCGTDEGGVGGSGIDYATAQAIFVSQSGDTVTGALIINVTGGVQNTIGLNVVNTASGAHLHAEKTLSSSGGVVWEGTASGLTLVVSNGLTANNAFIYGDITASSFTCRTGDCIGLGEIADSPTLDATLTFVAGGNDFIVNLSGAGDFVVQDNGATALKVNDDACVGIGDAGFCEAPEGEHINQADVSGAADGRANQFVIESTEEEVGMSIISNATATGVVVFADADNKFVGGIHYPHATDSLRFFTNASLAMTIDSSQEVGIGTTNADTKLEVVGTISGSLVVGNARTLTWYVDGTLTTGTAKAATLIVPHALYCDDVELAVDTAPATQAIIVDINEAGVSLFSTRPQISASTSTGSNAHVFSDKHLAAGKKLTMDIDQVGSGTAGSDLTVLLHCYARP